MRTTLDNAWTAVVGLPVRAADKYPVATNEKPAGVQPRDRLVIFLTVATCVVLPWPVAILNHNYEAAVAAVLGPALVGAKTLGRRGWRAPRDLR
jgi:hypothetical protein